MSKKQLLIIAIATLITVIGWVVFDIIHIRSNYTVSTDVQQLMEPIDPNIDLQGIN